jgi:hypothetical protein
LTNNSTSWSTFTPAFSTISRATLAMIFLLSCFGMIVSLQG